MADLIFSIETLPTVTAYDSESELLNPALFIAIAAEGQEEILYVEELEKLVKKYSSDINIIILNKFYARMKDAISLSHPSHRYELIEKWREYYSQKCGITENDEEWLICDRDNQSFLPEQYDVFVELQRNNSRFHFIVSNPAFQLWLLLHFTDSIPVHDIEQHEFCRDRIKEIEKILKENYVSDYVHGSLDWDKYKDHVRDAISNSQQYSALSVDDLKDKTGSHLYKLLEFIEDKLGKKVF